MSDGSERDFYYRPRWVHTEATQNTEVPPPSSLSLKSKLFMILATIQAAITLGLQISMAVIGYQQGPREDYYCLSPSQERLLNCVSIISGNPTGSLNFRDDKLIYIIFFIGLTVYNLVLCIYSFKQQDRVEVFAFIVTNTLTMLYAALQVYQFRSYGGDCGALTTIGWIAVANMIVLAVFALVFIFLSAMTYFEFGWKIYKHYNLMTALRNYFHWYEIFISGMKLVLLLTIIFGLAEVVLLLPPRDPEFALTIGMLLLVAVVCVLIHAAVQEEYRPAYFCIVVLGLLLIAYYIFKVERFASRSCPLCQLLDKINTQNKTLIEFCANKINATNETLPVARLDEITNLLIISLLNLITTIIVFAVFIKVWCFRGKGLKEHFAVHPSGPTRVIRAICNCRRTTANVYHVIPPKFTERSPLIQNKN